MDTLWIVLLNDYFGIGITLGQSKDQEDCCKSNKTKLKSVKKIHLEIRGGVFRTPKTLILNTNTQMNDISHNQYK